MNILFFLLTGYGITNIITREHIFSWLRNKTKGIFNQLITCSTCLGFWVGIWLYFFITINITNIILIDILFSGFILSGFNNIIEIIRGKTFI